MAPLRFAPSLARRMPRGLRTSFSMTTFERVHHSGGRGSRVGFGVGVWGWGVGVDIDACWIQGCGHCGSMGRAVAGYHITWRE
jgi:hypothetical protein